MRVEKQLWFWLAALLFAIGIIALLKDILLPFVAAIVIAYFLSPLADRLEALGINRGIAAVLIVGCGAVLIGLALVILGPILVDQLRRLATSLPDELQRIRTLVEDLAKDWFGPHFPAFQNALDRMNNEVSQNWAGVAGTIVASIWNRGVALVNFAALLLITPIVVFYLLIDWHPMLARIDKALPRDHAPTIRRLAGEINDAVAAFIRGQGAICLMLGIFYGIGLSWAGLDYGLLIGLTTGLLAFIPVVGWTVGLICAVSLAIVQFWPEMTPVIKVAGVLVAGIAMDTAFLSPRFVGGKIGLHPVWLIFALFVFSYLFGLVGTLVAVPLAAAIGVLVRFAIDVYLGSSVYKGVVSAHSEAPPSRGDAP